MCKSGTMGNDFKFQGLPGDRMEKTEPESAQGNGMIAWRMNKLRIVFAVTPKRGSGVGQLYPYLMMPPGFQGDMNQGKVCFPVL